MKTSLKAVLGVCLLLGLCFLFSTGLAIADPEALTIPKIDVFHSDQDLVLDITFLNNSDTAIDEFGIAIAFLDEDGNRVFGFDNTLDGYISEVCNWYYTSDEAITPGSRYLTEDIFAGYAQAEDIGIAIRYYHKEIDAYIMLPESEWQWIFPGYESAISSLSRTYYTTPPDALYDRINDFSLGYNYYLLDDFNASYYNKNQGGEWITSVSPESPAMNAGLAEGDLVLFADGIKPTENAYAVEYAIDKIMHGNPVDWVVERDGLIYVFRVTNP